MKKFLKSYGFILCMLLAIVAGCIVGAVWPQVKNASGEVIDKGATVLEPLGTVFINHGRDLPLHRGDRCGHYVHYRPLPAHRDGHACL